MLFEIRVHTGITLVTATECNDISLAIVRKSEGDLRRALTVSPHKINETNSMGQTALHLAVEWPAGLYLLLEAGADVDCRDSLLNSPLEYAIDRSLTEPLNALGHADCSLFEDFDDGRSLVLLRAIRIEIREPGNAAAERVVDVLTDLVIQRRRRLCDLAIRTLPASELAYFYPHGDHNSYLVDESALRLSSALEHHGIPIPSALDPGRDRVTVYHQIEGSSRVAERLWRAGFRDIDVRDSLGLTPLMVIFLPLLGVEHSINHYLECVAWFLNKGADINAKQDLTLYCEYTGRQGPSGSRLWLSATSLQFVAFDVGWAFGRCIYELDESYRLSLSEISKRVFEQIVTDNVPDGCVCACSIRGCKAFTSIIKGSLSYWGHGHGDLVLDMVGLWTILEDICDLLGKSEFLRCTTFEALGLTHTCCGWDGLEDSWVFSKIGDQSEIDEIHDVEAADLQMLEELLEEFEAKRIELDLPFSDFLKEYWQPRMKKIRNEGDLNKEALREIGVRIYESESDCSVDSES